MANSILITGASGFVAARLLDRLEPADSAHVYALSRKASPRTVARSERTGFTLVQADFQHTDTYASMLASVETVVHLAATTGKARPRDHFAVNAAGTRTLLEQCVRHGVRNFLYVSSIAAKFVNIDRYYYAQSKREAEAAVAASGLSYAIVRPTPVLGHEGATWAGLSKLARAPLMPVFGSGATKIQPIYVDDLADCLCTILHERLFRNETLELGGTDVVSIECLLRRIRQAYGRKGLGVVHLPLRPVRGLLACLEPLLLALLPLTAGQLATFSEDGTITPNHLFQRHAGRMKNVEEMIALSMGPTESRCHAPTCARV
jgi:NADH dehydrogenase